jgi:hypothetical protein
VSEPDVLRLGIVIPYRDRAEHLSEFRQAVPAFFRDDPLHARIEPRFIVVEQAEGLPFNRGALKNVGFQLLAGEIDYVCLHDVDLIPVSADYRWPDRPTMIVRHGIPHPPEMIPLLLGGVVLLAASQFAAANGFSNSYWGWGFEDVDLRERLSRVGFPHGHREGTFRRLPHVDQGSHEDGTPTPDHLKNQGQFIARWFDRHGAGWRRKTVADGWRADGLASLAFNTVAPRKLVADAPLIEHVVVDFPAQDADA